MKGLLSFIISVALYIVLGLILWNIVCSNIDVLSKTLEDLSEYKLWTYSGLTLAIAIVCSILLGTDSTDFSFWVVSINFLIALLVNQWESAWPSVNLIFTIIYNLVNIGLIALLVRSFFDKNSN